MSWELIATSPSGRYRLYENDKQFQIAVVYVYGDKTYENSVFTSKGDGKEEFLPVFVKFENEENYDKIVENKIKAKLKRSKRMSKLNVERMERGEHQFVKDPSIQKKATERHSELWKKANNGVFENSHHEDWTNGKRNNEGLINKAKTMWRDEEFRESQTVVCSNNISKYNEACKVDPEVQRERSIRQSKVSKKNWQNEDYRRSVINGLIDAIEEGRWTPPYKNSKKGWHYSSKTGQSHFYRSSYEERMYHILDKDENVVTYETECFRIEYYFGDELHITVPDIFASYINGEQSIVEVKTEYMLNDKLTLAKLTAMKEFSESEGYGFWLVTETVLDNLEIDKQEEVVLC